MRKVVFLLFLFALLGSLFSSPRSILKDDYIVNDDTLFGRPQRNPSIDRNSIGMTVVVFEDDRNWYESMSDVWGQILDSLGNLVSYNFLVNEYTDNNQGNPDVALTPSGRFIVVFEDERNGEPDIYGRIFLPSGEALGSDFRINDDPQGAFQRNPRVAFVQDKFIVIFEDTRNGETRIYAQFIDTTGTFVGSNRLLVNAPPGTNQTEPDITVNSSGRIFIIWKDDRSFSSTGYDIYGGIWDSEGVPLVPPLRLNDDGGSANQESPEVIVLEGIGFFGVWNDEREGNPDIYAQLVDTLGSLVRTNFKINDDGTNTTQEDPSVAACSSYILVTFTDYRNDEANVYGQFYDFNVNPVGTNFLVNDNLAGEQKNPSVAGYGIWIVVFSDSRSGEPDIYAQRYSLPGVPLYNNYIVVYEETEHSMYWQSRPGVAVSSDGSYWVVFYDDRNMDMTGGPSIYAQHYNSSGDPLGGNIQVEDFSGAWRDHPDVAISSLRNALVVFEDTREGESYIFGQLYDENGSPLGDNFRIGDSTGFGQYLPSIAFSPMGYFVVIWQDLRGGDYDIYGQFIREDGSLCGNNFLIESGNPGENQITPDISVSGTGKIFVVFSDDRDFNLTGFDVYGIFLNPDGSPMGSSFKINDDNVFQLQINPRCAQSSFGDAVSVWVDYRDQDTKGSDIYGQWFDVEGNPVGSNFLVNDDISSEMQEDPDVAMDETGGFMVVFSDERNDGQPDLYAQVYLPEAEPYGSNYQVSQDSPFEIQQNTPKAHIGDNRLVIVWQAFPDPDHVSNWNPDVFAELTEWIPPTFVEEREPTFFTNFGIYPNILRREGFVLFYLKKSAYVETKLYDILGRLKGRRTIGKRSPGIYKIPINFSNLPSGVYFLELHAENQRERKRILLIR